MAEGTVAADELRLLIERIERLEEEKKAIADDVKDIYLEAKSRGYDVKTVRAIVRLRKMETHVRQEAEALLEIYKAALGMDFSGTPLGNAGVQQAARAYHDSLERSGASKVTMQVSGEEPVTLYERKPEAHRGCPVD